MKPSLRVHLFPVLLGAACVSSETVGDSPQDTEGGSDSATTTMAATSASGTGQSSDSSSTTSESTSGQATEGSSTTQGGGSETTESTGGSVIGCEGNPLFTCSEPRDCAEVPCGGYLSEWDEDGCLRPRCDNDEACPDGMACLRPFEWDACYSSDPTTCEDVDGTCTCGGSTLPDCGGRYCIPESAAPPAACDELVGQQACETAGCRYMNITPILEDTMEAPRCADQPEGACLWFPEGEGGDDILIPYRRLLDFNATFPTGFAVFPADYDVAPLGWVSCSDLPNDSICTWWSGIGSCQ